MKELVHYSLGDLLQSGRSDDAVNNNVAIDLDAEKNGEMLNKEGKEAADQGSRSKIDPRSGRS